VVFSPYDEKILQESVHYGLPMYRVSGTAATAATASIAPASVGASAVDGTDPVTGVPTSSVEVDLPIAASSGPGQLHRVDTPDGSYFEIDGQVVTVQHRPIQPRFETDVTDPDLVAHGFLVTDLTSNDLTGFEPLFFQPIVDDSGNEDLTDPIGDAIFPATLGRVARSIDADGAPTASLELAAGQFRPTGVGVGTQRLFTAADILVQYADPAVTDFDAPTILQSRGALVPVLGVADEVVTQTAGFAVDTDPSAQRVYVLFKPATGSGQWEGVDLVRSPGTDHWTGGAVVPNDVEQLEFFVQACDDHGNCSMSDNKASGFIAEQDPVGGELSVVVSGAPQAAGWWLGAVQATVTGGPGAALEYSLDGGEFTDYTGPVPVTGEGVHFLTARDDDGASESVVIPIDTLGPITTGTVTPVAGVTGWHTGAATVEIGAVDPGGSGVASIEYAATGGQTIAPTTVAGDTASVLVSSAGTTTVSFSSTDAAGNVGPEASVTVRIDLAGPVVSCGAADGQWHATNVSIACTASDAGAGLASPADASFSLSTTVAAGVETATASTGTRSVCDVFDRCSTAGPITGNKVDRKAPTIAITTPVAGAVFSVGQSVTPSFTCTDGGSGVASCTSNGVNTATVGTRTFTVTAIDAVGNTSTLSRTYTVGYRICLLYNPTKPSPRGGTVPIKLQLCNAAGANLSSSAIQLRALTVDGVLTPPPFPGSSNDDFFFRYVASTQSYIYNLDTGVLPIGRGAHTLQFSVGGTALAAYEAPFALK
jgi:hypothetical protein